MSVDNLLEGDVSMSGAEERDYQVKTAAELLDRPHDNALVQAEVGAGKTEIGLQAIAAQQNYRDDYSAMVVVPNRRLLSQWVDRIDAYDMELDVKVNENSANEDRQVVEGRIPSHPEITDHDEQKLIERERQKRNPTKEKMRTADLFVTTYDQLSHDIRNDKINDLEIDFDEVVIDEATHAVSQIMPGDTEDSEEYVGGFRLDKRFQDFFDGLYADTRIVGLTAMPGARIRSMSDVLDADVIKPPEDQLDEHTPEVESSAFEFEDETLESLSTGLKVRYRNSMDALGNQLEKEYDIPEANPRLAIQFANVGGEVGKAARNVLKKRSELAKFSEAVAYPEGGDQGYKTTPKGEFLRDMSVNLPSVDEQYIVFTKHRSTAENAVELMSENADVETVNGERTNGQNDEAINAYRDGDLDALVMTYGAGGEGLDLDNADRIIHLSSYNSPSQRASATGRGKRGSDVTEHNLGYGFEPEWREAEREQYGAEPSPSSISVDRVKDVLEPEPEGNESEDGGPDWNALNQG